MALRRIRTLDENTTIFTKPYLITAGMASTGPGCHPSLLPRIGAWRPRRLPPSISYLLAQQWNWKLRYGAMQCSVRCYAPVPCWSPVLSMESLEHLLMYPAGLTSSFPAPNTGASLPRMRKKSPRQTVGYEEASWSQLGWRVAEPFSPSSFSILSLRLFLAIIFPGSFFCCPRVLLLTCDRKQNGLLCSGRLLGVIHCVHDQNLRYGGLAIF